MDPDNSPMAEVTDDLILASAIIDRMLAAISRKIFDLTADPEALVSIAIIVGLVFVVKNPVEPVKVGLELEPVLGMA